MKPTLSIIFLLFVFNIFGQGNCFEDYKANSKKYDSLKYDSNGNFNNSNSLEINKKIINNLIGCKIPDFTAKTIDGKTLSSQNLKGKIIVLNFWYAACSPCVAEIPALNKLVEEYKDSDVVFIAFSSDDSLKVKTFIQNKEFNYNMVSSKFDMKEKFCIIGGYPTNMVFDRNGILRQIFCGGPIDETAKIKAYNLMKPTIDKYLKEE